MHHNSRSIQLWAGASVKIPTALKIIVVCGHGRVDAFSYTVLV